LILLYEGVGTAMMTTLVYNYFAQLSQGNNIPTEGEDIDKIQQNTFLTYFRVRDNTGLLLGMFVTIMFAARISGSHFNPIITLSYMFGNVKQGKFDRILGLLYIVA
jgi:glycerol uptake facilitator-like aquaporin